MSKSNKKPIKICQEKPKDFLKEYNLSNKELIQQITHLVFPRRTLKSTPLQDCKYRLRDSIIYRAESIRFHLELLFYTKNSIERKLILDLGKKDDLFLMILGRENLMQIFDDIVFHICSMFDYLGNLIGLLYCGQDRMKLKWNGVLKSIGDEKNELSKISIAPICKKIHKELVDPLFNYRGRLIHYNTDSARGSQKISIKEGFVNIDFDIGFPAMLKKSAKIKCLEKIKSEDQEEANIIEIARILSLESVRNTIEIIKNISPKY